MGETKDVVDCVACYFHAARLPYAVAHKTVADIVTGVDTIVAAVCLLGMA